MCFPMPNLASEYSNGQWESSNKVHMRLKTLPHTSRPAMAQEPINAIRRSPSETEKFTLSILRDTNRPATAKPERTAMAIVALMSSGPWSSCRLIPGGI